MKAKIIQNMIELLYVETQELRKQALCEKEFLGLNTYEVYPVFEDALSALKAAFAECSLGSINYKETEKSLNYYKKELFKIKKINHNNCEEFQQRAEKVMQLSIATTFYISGVQNV